mmetsp:Transcript_25843/g.53415  ORF Transcript_25843/g.53415 Transcript_25843/m.53415 type:complete len:87 (+) Transcript_25843:68-328(+)
MPSSCSESLSAMWSCVQASDCAKEVRARHPGKQSTENKAFADEMKACINAPNGGAAGDCSELRYAYFECKRQNMDMRSRIRGQKAL